MKTNVFSMQFALTTALLVVGTVVSPMSIAEDILPDPIGLDGIAIPGEKWEKLHEATCFTEGIAVSPEGVVYFSDITSTLDCTENGVGEGAILKFDPSTNKTSVFRSPSGQSNGMIFSREGDLVYAQGPDYGGRRVSRIDMETGRSYILAHSFKGRRLNSPNDVAIGPDGLIYFTDPRYGGHESIEQPIQGLYRIEQNGTVNLVIADASKPNGLAFSPDGKTLYVAAADDNGSTDASRLDAGQVTHVGLMAVLSYAANDDGSFGDRNVLINYHGVDTYGPDGLNVDANGNLYVALFGGNDKGIFVYSPSGKQLGYFPTGKFWATNTAFATTTDGAHYLYMTAGKSLYRIKIDVAGTK